MEENGIHRCPILLQFEDHRQEMRMEMQKLDSVINAIADMRQDMGYLKSIADTLSEIKTSLINGILGKDSMPVQTANDLLKGQRDSYQSIVKTVCWSMAVVVGILVGVQDITKLPWATWLGH